MLYQLECMVANHLLAQLILLKVRGFYLLVSCKLREYKRCELCTLQQMLYEKLQAFSVTLMIMNIFATVEV